MSEQKQESERREGATLLGLKKEETDQSRNAGCSQMLESSQKEILP